MPTYKPGAEPPKIRKRLDTLFQKLDAEYPTKEIVGLSTKHKKWAETVSELRKILEYPDNSSFLAAYGYSVGEGAKGGRPSNNADLIVEELLQRRPEGKPYRDMSQLREMNPDMSGKIKTLSNSSNKLFGKKISEHFFEIGLIANARVVTEEEANRRAEAQELGKTILEALGRRYPSGSTLPTSFGDLCGENPDLPIRRAYTEGAFPTPVKDYFMELGYIADQTKAKQKQQEKVDRAFETLSRRYKDNPYHKLEEIVAENLDLAHILWQDSEDRRLLVTKLRKAGIIGKAKPKIVDETPAPSGLNAGEYCYCKVAVENVRRHYAYICKIKGIRVGDYVQVPFGGDNNLTPALVTEILICTERTAPYPPQLTKKIRRRLSAGEPINATIPRDIALIKRLSESGEIIKAGVASGSYSFLYETTCAVCGKHKLVNSHELHWNLHHTSVFSKDDAKKRAAAIQKHLDKYGIAVQLNPNLHEGFTNLPDTCFCDLERPWMVSIWGGGRILSIDKEAGTITMEAEAWSNIEPLSDSIDNAMMVRIEALSLGDHLQYVSRPYERGEYVEIQNGAGEVLGCLPQILSAEILDGIKKNVFTAEDFKASAILSRKQQGLDAKQSKLTITFTLTTTDRSKPLNWLIRDRVEYLCKRSSNLSINEAGTSVSEIPNSTLSSEFAMEPQKGKYYFCVDTLLQGSERGACRITAESLSQGVPMFLERQGTIADGDARFAVCDEHRNKVGWLGDSLSSTIAILVDTGIATIHELTFLGRSKKGTSTSREYEMFTKVRMLVSIDCTGIPEASPFACDADAYTGQYQNASEKYRRLAATLKLKYPYEWFSINDYGELFMLRYCDTCGGALLNSGHSDFGFNTESGRFNIWNEIPEDDVVDMLEHDGIDILLSKYIEDWCECDMM